MAESGKDEELSIKTPGEIIRSLSGLSIKTPTHNKIDPISAPLPIGRKESKISLKEHSPYSSNSPESVYEEGGPEEEGPEENSPKEEINEEQYRRIKEWKRQFEERDSLEEDKKYLYKYEYVITEYGNRLKVKRRSGEIIEV